MRNEPSHIRIDDRTGLLASPFVKSTKFDDNVDRRSFNNDRDAFFKPYDEE